MPGAWAQAVWGVGPAERRGAKLRAGGGAADGMYVILVDDDQDVLDLYRIGLEACGFTVDTARDGDGLFAGLDGKLPDVVVVDWQLANMHGDQVVRQIRMDYRLASVPVFMLSNFPSHSDGAIDRVFELGVLGWFEKTKTPPVLLGHKLVEALAARLRGAV